ncbi:MAG: glycosyltransferase [Neisseriaceae bacterium]|nr:MAG: glycosyltransferase [Neisseriaceae bacterium]
MSSKISALIIAKNEHDNITECLKSVSFCDEVIVIDDFSDDDTVELAQSLGATIYQRAMNGDYGAQQNFAISKAKNPWLLLIDCDERITEPLKNEILQVVQNPPLVAYQIKRLNHFNAKRVYFGTMRPDYVCRLIPREGTSIQGKVHQKTQHPYSEDKLKNGMLHYTYQSWEEYYAKFDRYTQLSAEKYLFEGKTSHFFLDLTLKPLWSFIKMYFIHLGFLDGKLGFVLAKNHYFYTYTKYMRFYYLQHPIVK